MGKKVIAVDLGGTHLRVAVVEGRKVERFVQIDTPKTKESLLNSLCRFICERMDKDVIGIGMGSPGPLREGFIENSPNIALKNFNLKAYLEKKFKKRVYVENDANCFAIAEHEYGCRKNNFFVLTFGTGIGGGVFVDGKLVNGNGRGGELGHIILDNGKDFEFYWKQYKEKSQKIYGRKMLIKELVKKNDPKAKKIIRELADYTAQGIASLIHVFDPEIVILAGGAREGGVLFLKEIKKKLKDYVIFKNVPDVRWTFLKEPGILGASLLVR